MALLYRTDEEDNTCILAIDGCVFHVYYGNLLSIQDKSAFFGKGDAQLFSFVEHL